MPWSHVRPMMALKGDKSSTTESCTFWITGPTWTGSTTFPKEVFEPSLNPNSIRLGFSRADGGNPICLYADICNRLVELPGSTKIHLISNSLIPNVRIRASLCGCSTRLGSIGGKVIVPSTRGAPLLGKLCWMELTYSFTEATRSSLFFFRLELYFLSTPLSPMDVVDHDSRDRQSCRGLDILGHFPTSSIWVDILFQRLSS